MSIFLFMIAIRIFERPVTRALNEMGSSDSLDFGNFFSCFWFIIITMTTVGYGDLYPRTLLGRTLNIFISLYGICIVSMIVSIL